MSIESVIDLRLDSDSFHLAPVSLWLRDYSGILPLFAAWRADGVRSLASHFAADSGHILECVARVRVIKVNRYTVDLFDAGSESDLLGPLLPLLALESLENAATAFLRFWDGYSRYTRQTVKRSLSGRHLDVIVTGTALPGSEQTLDRVLVAVQDITGQEAAYRRLAAAERYARSLFEHSPISLWVEDFSMIRDMLDELRARGVRDFAAFVDAHPEFIQRCVHEIRIVEVNDQTLRLFGAPDLKTLVHHLSGVFRPEGYPQFRDELIDLWEGKLYQQREITNFTVGGDRLICHMQFSVFPGHEHDWALVQVALTDITARKRAEAHLEFLSKRDELTGLFNRAFYVGEIARLKRMRQFPLSVIIIDLNGLKRVNDTYGHAAGDEMLRRMGEILSTAVLLPASASRTGGDEFAVLMPLTDTAEACGLLERITLQVERDNALHPGNTLSMAAGIGTAHFHERVEDAVRSADSSMYDAKAQFYLDRAHESRR